MGVLCPSTAKMESEYKQDASANPIPYGVELPLMEIPF